LRNGSTTLGADFTHKGVLQAPRTSLINSLAIREALQEAMERFGQPELFNTDQGVQFTSAAFLDELEGRGVRVSMDSKGRFLDNIFIERLWPQPEVRRSVHQGVWFGCRGTSRYRRVARVLQ
jgi:transposase InsO family protein